MHSVTRQDWLKLIRGGLTQKGTPEFRLFWCLVVSSIPAAIVGKLLDHWAEENLRAPLLIALTLVAVGFFIGTAGSGETGGTTSANLTVTPDDQVRPSAPGATATFPVYVKNSTDYGVRFTSISAGSSTATASG